jgi:hypothetical protein
MRPLAACLLLSLAGPASAAQRFYGWAYPDAVNEEGQVEWEAWIHLAGRDIDYTDADAAPRLRAELWNGPTVGLTERLELAVFGLVNGQFSRNPGEATNASFGASVKIHLRYNLLPRPSADGLGITVMGGFEQSEMFPISENKIEVRVMGGWRSGRFDGTVNLAHHDYLPGATIPGAPHSTEYDLGASCGLGAVIRLGVEAFGFYHWNGKAPSLFLGPALFIRKGRFWWSLSHGFGHLSPEAGATAAARSVVGIAF